MVTEAATRTVRRFAWLPVLLTGEPWYDPRSWVHLGWYEAEQARAAPDDLEPWGTVAREWRTTATHRAE